MTFVTHPSHPSSVQERFPGNIHRTFLLVVIPLSLLPFIIIGSIVFIRARNLLIDQVNNQINVNIHTIAEEIDLWLTNAKIRLDAAVNQPPMSDALDRILGEQSPSSAEFTTARSEALAILQEINLKRGGITFTDFFVLSASGEILAATQPTWEGQQFAANISLSNQSHSLVAIAPQPIGEDKIVVLAYVPYANSQSSGFIVGILSSIHLQNILQSVTKIQPNANSYFISGGQTIFGIDTYTKKLAIFSPTNQQLDALSPLSGQYVHGSDGPQEINLSLHSLDQGQSLASYTWIPSLQAGYVFEVPVTTAFQHLQSLTPFTLYAVGILLILVSITLWIVSNRLAEPIRALTETTRLFAQGDWNQRVPENRRDEIGLLSFTFNQMAEELSSLYHSLSSQVADQTLELHKRSSQFEATAQVAREAAAIRNLDELLTHTTHLIAEHFGFYHAGIFLMDEDHHFAVLQAANSEGGQRMLARSHKLGVGQTGVVGRVAETGLPRIALDVGEDRFFFDNPDLPETRSEMALPLKVQNTIIGVLDVQSKLSGAFTSADTEALQIMADQIALAIENARLLEQSQNTVQELQLLYSRQIDQAWSQLLGHQPIAYHFDRVRVKIAPDEQIAALEKADSAEVQIKDAPDGTHLLIVPLSLRGYHLGDINLRRAAGEPRWTTEDQELAQEVAVQIAVALENARLLEESRRRAAQEEMLSQATARFSQSLDIDTVLQMAVKELGQLAGVTEVFVELS